MHQTVTIAGAGLSGAVVARQLADAGHPVTVYEARDHVGGNCHTERDPETGILLHRHGPHIFHTDNARVWRFVQRFATFKPSRHTVRTTVKDRVYGLPVNLQTINQFFGTHMGSDEARAFVAGQIVPVPEPESFEQAALSSIGPALYEAFFEGYTTKQWGCPPSEIPASVFKRLPVRFNYDDSYFSHPMIGIPEGGYTAMIEAMLDHPLIRLVLGQPVTSAVAARSDHLFWTGTLDGYFDHRLGRLEYRTLEFEELRGTGDWQGCAVMNYGDKDVPFTRITEHKHLAPWENHNATVLYRETVRDCGPDDIPYYPTRRLSERAKLDGYLELAQAEHRVSFVGRLGTYRYLDMDTAIQEALDTASAYLSTHPSIRTEARL